MDLSLAQFSEQLATTVERAARRVVAVESRGRGRSSGLIWRDELIVTPEQGLAEEEQFLVSTPDGEEVEAELVGRHSGLDVAVLRAPGAPLPAEVANAEDVRAGALALTVGRTRAGSPSATLGAVSATGGGWRSWRGDRIERLIRLDMNVYPGFTGSAVVDATGRLIGSAAGGLSRRFPLALPPETLGRVVSELVERGRVVRGYLGVGLQPAELSPHLQKELDFTSDSALIALTVEPEAPAEQAGVMLGDLILSIGGRPIRSMEDLQEALEGDAVGSPASLVVGRGGKRVELEATPVERPARGR